MLMSFILIVMMITAASLLKFVVLFLLYYRDGTKAKVTISVSYCEQI